MSPTESDIQMQREAAPIRVGDLTLQPMTLRRVNAAGAMRCSIFNLDAIQRRELVEEKTYRGIIRDIIIVFYLCAHSEQASDLALWSPVESMGLASDWAAKNGVSETSELFVDFQAALWSLVNPLFSNDANQEVPKGETELGRSKKKHVER